MTVPYYSSVHTTTSLGFVKLLLRWRGSMYRLLWKDFLLFFVSFYTLSLIYNFMLTSDQMRVFESLCSYCDQYVNLIKAGWMIGLYVGLVVIRFYAQIDNIPFLTRYALFIASFVRGQGGEDRLIRRTILRYLNLANVITYISISPVIKKRFPTLQHVTDAGFMNQNEQTMLEMAVTRDTKFYVPLVWAANLIIKARKDGMIKNDMTSARLIAELLVVRDKLLFQFRYDWVPVPILYTQVVTWSVYTFLLACLFARQRLVWDSTEMYFPFFTFVQFFFYMGWLKVGEELMNPFGEDDDDYNCNGFFDNALKTAYMVVDEVYDVLPEMTQDQYWNNITDTQDIAYAATGTETASKYPVYLGSSSRMHVSNSGAEFVADPTDEQGFHLPHWHLRSRNAERRRCCARRKSDKPEAMVQGVRSDAAQSAVPAAAPDSAAPASASSAASPPFAESSAAPTASSPAASADSPTAASAAAPAADSAAQPAAPAATSASFPSRSKSAISLKWKNLPGK